VNQEHPQQCLSSVPQTRHKECTSQKQQDDTLWVIVRTTLSWLQSLSVKNQISPFATLQGGTEGPSRNIRDAHIILTLLSRFLRVDVPWLRQKLGI